MIEVFARSVGRPLNQYIFFTYLLSSILFTNYIKAVAQIHVDYDEMKIVTAFREISLIFSPDFYNI